MTRNTAINTAVSLPDALAGRSIVLVGLMGAGKTSIGRRLAGRLGLPFCDADAEIEQAAGCTVPELFARYGEPAFREGERKVIRRLLADEPVVLASGGGRVHGPFDPRHDTPPRRFQCGCAVRCPPWFAGLPGGSIARCSTTVIRRKFSRV